MNPNSTPAEQREHFHELLKEFRTAMLVTHAERLCARPMQIAKLEDDGRLWFFTGADSAKTHEIEADTEVHLICQKEYSIYLFITGTATLVHDRAKIAELWQEPFRVWFPDGKDDPNIVLISVTPHEGEYWDNAGINKIKYLFKTAKAYITGTTPDIKDAEQHGRTTL